MPPATLPELSAQNVLYARARLGEGPLWDSDQQVLYWVDILNHRVHVFEPSSGDDCHWDVGDVGSAIALMRGNRLLVAMGNRIASLDLSSGAVETLHTFEFDAPGTRFNDGKCDPQGRFWIGSMSPENPGHAALYRYDPDGSVRTMETNLTISNGLGWSPDGGTFYLTDSPQRKIFAYRFDGETGEISDCTVAVDLGDEPVEPDGLTIDSEGNIWTALWDGWCVACFSPTGEALGRIKLPVQRPTCPTFGGPDLSTIYVTTASVGLSQKEIQQGFYSGDVFAIAAPAPGLPPNPFGLG
ncbi:SMP-30/gluconolactonase/LRE family protein [Nodosilinea sp. LEGE 06152]|uniref:SMP-30/gluconolactonase/LRE family protein n=1 Tax=Nodosilinea sp. LEGE 06152 TaxID=2777966 RepID=UPI0018814A83|nr:SMP-30/gluconolactonase/LRE family protein [Nodosilinea sp. LEGE 06152]MBE9155439.1 SMP-30/gluconolactonase/LRE family protein [Nodosilinea sp. LEGE 06152]